MALRSGAPSEKILTTGAPTGGQAPRHPPLVPCSWDALCPPSPHPASFTLPRPAGSCPSRAVHPCCALPSPPTQCSGARETSAHELFSYKSPSPLLQFPVVSLYTTTRGSNLCREGDRETPVITAAGYSRGRHSRARFHRLGHCNNNNMMSLLHRRIMSLFYIQRFLLPSTTSTARE